MAEEEHVYPGFNKYVEFVVAPRGIDTAEISPGACIELAKKCDQAIFTTSEDPEAYFDEFIRDEVLEHMNKIETERDFWLQKAVHRLGEIIQKGVDTAVAMSVGLKEKVLETIPDTEEEGYRRCLYEEVFEVIEQAKSELGRVMTDLHQWDFQGNNFEEEEQNNEEEEEEEQ